MTDQVQQTETPENQPQLQLADLLVAVQAIQLASQRGGFRPEEFTQIGGVYERIVKFLQANNVIQPKAEQQEQETTPAA